MNMVHQAHRPSRGVGVSSRWKAQHFLSILTFLCQLVDPLGSVSFYGNSHVSVKMLASVTETEIKLKMKTRQPDGTLFLATGSTDYCLVIMHHSALKVRINLGAGEAEVSSPPGLTLDDLVWHDVHVSTAQTYLHLSIDGVHNTSVKLPGRFFELNIDKGVYIGGVGNSFKQLFLGILPNFRGCIDQVWFNGVEIFQLPGSQLPPEAANSNNKNNKRPTGKKGTTKVTGQLESYSVTWDSCRPEFHAGRNTPISWVEEGGFAVFPHGVARTGGDISFELKTETKDCLLVYLSGDSYGSPGYNFGIGMSPASQPSSTSMASAAGNAVGTLMTQADLLAIVLVGGNVVLLLDKGNGLQEIVSSKYVSDGQWHSISVRVTVSVAQIQVDGSHSVSNRSEFGTKKFLDLSDKCFVGGLDVNQVSRALRQGMSSAAIQTMKGCLRNLQLGAYSPAAGFPANDFDGTSGNVIGLPDALVTQGLSPGCQWEFLCSTRNPCIQDAACVQDGLSSFKCSCDNPPCVRSDYDSGSYSVYANNFGLHHDDLGKNKLSSGVKLLSVSPVEVEEGGAAVITADQHLNFAFQPESYGVRESGVLFHVLTPPKHGKIHVDRPIPSGNEIRKEDGLDIFTLQELLADKVRYVHDGSETQRDSISLELQLTQPNNKQTGLAKTKNFAPRFLVMFKIRPVNDAPQFTMPALNVLRIAKGTSRTVTRNIISVTDPDSEQNELKLTVKYSNTGSKPGVFRPPFYFQLEGKRTMAFTMADIDAGLLTFACSNSITPEDENIRIVLSIDDGKSAASSVLLRVAPFDLKLQVDHEAMALQSNTSLLAMTHSSWALLGPRNLPVRTNAETEADDDDGDGSSPGTVPLIFRLTTPFKYGQLERLKTNGMWQKTSEFTRWELEGARVRYVHMADSPETDEAAVKVSVDFDPQKEEKNYVSGDQEETVYVKIRVTFVELSVVFNRLQPVTMEEPTQVVISSQSLSVNTKPAESEEHQLLYILESNPLFGTLHVMKTSEEKAGPSLYSQQGPTVSTAGIARETSNFTQEDIDRGLVLYSLSEPATHSLSILRERIKFRVEIASTPGHGASMGEATRSDSKILEIIYAPRRSKAMGLQVEVLKTLEVLEGSKKALDKGTLWLESQRAKKLRFNVALAPQHGELLLFGKPTTSFTSDELSNKKVFYSHDGSETEADSFEFIATGQEKFFYFGELKIKVVLRNDNPPISARPGIGNVLQVAEGQEKIISRRNLHYSDADKGTLPSDLLYKITDLFVAESKTKSTAGFYLVDPVAKTRKRVSAFTQQQVDIGSILYVDDGAVAYKRVNFMVSDGEFKTEDHLEVISSKPFIRVETSTGLILPRGSTMMISQRNLSAYTNLNLKPEEIVFSQVKLPVHGELVLAGKALMPGENFTQAMILSGDLEYRHRGSSAGTADEFAFVVSGDEQGVSRAEGIFQLKILPRGYWEKLRIRANKSLLVEEDDFTDLHFLGDGSMISNQQRNLGSVVTSNHLEIFHPSVPPSDITFTVIRDPAFGVLRHADHDVITNGIDDRMINVDTDYSTRTFDQGTVNSGKLVYLPRQLDGAEDFFVLDVTNGITRLKNLTFKIVMVPKFINLDIEPLFIMEGQSKVITEDDIRIGTDFYTDKIKLYLVEKQPSHGVIELVSKPGKQLAKFTPGQLKEGLVQYVHDGSEVPWDQAMLVARAMDGRESALTPLSFNVTQVNDQPPKVVSKAGESRLKIWQGGVLPLGPDSLHAEDLDTSPYDIIYNVETVYGGEIILLTSSYQNASSGLVSGGKDGVKVESLLPLPKPSLSLHSKVSGEAALKSPASVSFPTSTAAVFQLSQAQVDEGLLLFKHTGGPNAGFRYVISDGVHVSQAYALNLTVENVRLTLVMKEKLDVFPLMSGVIGPQHLLALTNDPYDERTSLKSGLKLNSWQLGTRSFTFKIKSGPKLGRVLLRRENLVTPLGSQMDSFTQADINGSRVVYEHTTYEPQGDTMNDVPKKDPSKLLTDSMILQVETEFAPTLDNVVFEVEISLGGGGGDLHNKLRVRQIAVEEGSTACLVPEESINVTPISLYLAEHHSKILLGQTTTNGTPLIVVKLMADPAHGHLIDNGRKLKPQGEALGVELSSSALSEGLICYVHDHSDTLNDSVPLGIFLRKKDAPGSSSGAADIFLFNASLPVKVDPVNDQPFKLVTRPAVLEVVQGMTATLTPENLLAIDNDTQPSDIQYQIVDGPKLGRLRVEKPSTSITNIDYSLSGRRVSVNSPTDLSFDTGSVSQTGTGLAFTQEDINNGCVKYDHAHESAEVKKSHVPSLTPDAFYFKVWDGHFKPVYQRVHVKIIPLMLNMKNHSTISIKQGNTVVFFGNENLGAETNGDIGRVTYNVSKPPQYGKIMLRGSEAGSHLESQTNVFTQFDVNNQRVFFLQTNLSSPWDWFVATVHDGQLNSIPELQIRIEVEPLVMTREFNMTFGEKYPLTTAVLSASQLEKLTRSEPVFQIVKRPSNAKIRINEKPSARAKRSRSNKAKQILQFTQSDLRERRVHIISRTPPQSENFNLRSKIVADSFEFLLTADGVQPAKGVLVFHLVPRTKRDLDYRLKQGDDNTKDDFVIPVPLDVMSNPSITQDSWVMATIVAGVVSLAVVVVVAIKCFIARKRTTHDNKTQDGNHPSGGSLDLNEPDAGTGKRRAKKKGKNRADGGQAVCHEDQQQLCQVSLLAGTLRRQSGPHGGVPPSLDHHLASSSATIPMLEMSDRYMATVPETQYMGHAMEGHRSSLETPMVLAPTYPPDMATATLSRNQCQQPGCSVNYCTGTLTSGRQPLTSSPLLICDNGEWQQASTAGNTSCESLPFCQSFAPIINNQYQQPSVENRESPSPPPPPFPADVSNNAGQEQNMSTFKNPTLRKNQYWV